MSARDVNARVEIRGGYQGGPEPWRQTASLGVDVRGFLDVEGIGRAGDDPATLDLSDVRASLLATFDKAELCELLDNFVRLRKSLDTI